MPDAANGYSSASQSARVLSELWASRWLYCMNCGNEPLTKFENNKPVADLYCAHCGNEYELKSQKVKFGRTIANGAYSKKIERLQSNSSPNLVLLHYSSRDRRVLNLTAIPRRFFIPSIIHRRAPLRAGARRAGWVGSNILLHLIPTIGRVPIVKDGAVVRKEVVLDQWQQTAFLDALPKDRKGWLIDVMSCVDRIDAETFCLDDVYQFEDHLSRLYPNNNNVRPKIRQQLQVLREQGFLEFLGKGLYRKVKSTSR